MHAVVLAVCCMISGNVHAVSGTPVSGAHVVLQGPVPGDVSTDANGDFTLTVRPERRDAASICPW